MAIELYDHQKEAINKLKNGSILCGDVGSGKSLTALAYYYLQNGGSPKTLLGGDYTKMKNPPKDLYIITTARKRDTMDWEGEMIHFLMYPNKKNNLYSNTIVIDSWNNIKKYKDVKHAFFIFDEQRVIGNGVWVKAFLKIVKVNEWLLLSATPGDTWSDYIPVFIANGYYKHKTHFVTEHIVYSRFTSFPKVERYLNTKKLEKIRSEILVPMDFVRDTISHRKEIITEYDKPLYKETNKRRWDPYKDEPIINAGSLCYILRKIVNSDPTRGEAVLELVKKHKKVIIFYNFNYELDLLRTLDYDEDVVIGEWNGHKHEPIPDTDEWVYLVQYTAGSEGWNCIETDTIIFYSQNYSYRVTHQASGRINRVNTPFTHLYYYHLKSMAPIDLGVQRALRMKKNFNVKNFIKW